MDHATKFQKLVQFRVPETLSDAIEATARRHCQTKSEYIRRSVFDGLKADGINSTAQGGPVSGPMPARRLMGALIDPSR